MSHLKIFVLLVAFQAAFGYLGFDVGTPQGAVSEETFSCLLGKGYEFAIIEAWDGGYHVNPDFTQNYKNAKAAGFKNVDLYVFAANNCDGNSPSEVISGVKGALPSDFDGMMWLDIEPCSGCWQDSSSNLQYVNSLAQAAQSAGFKVGVYSSEGSWEGVVGSYSAGSSFLASLPLWYAHYDGSENFDDTSFYEFGGWKNAQIKQYGDSGDECGTTFDLDYAESLNFNGTNPGNNTNHSSPKPSPKPSNGKGGKPSNGGKGGKPSNGGKGGKPSNGGKGGNKPSPKPHANKTHHESPNKTHHANKTHHENKTHPHTNKTHHHQSPNKTHHNATPKPKPQPQPKPTEPTTQPSVENTNQSGENSTPSNSFEQSAEQSGESSAENSSGAENSDEQSAEQSGESSGFSSGEQSGESSESSGSNEDSSSSSSTAYSNEDSDVFYV